MQRAQGKSRLPDSKAARVWLLIAVSLLVAIGLVMVYSVTSVIQSGDGENPFADVGRQMLYGGIGVVAMLLIWRCVPPRAMIGRAMWAYYIACMVMLVLTFLVGTEVNGAKRWLYLGPIGFQPAEFVKVALLLMTIRILYDYNVDAIRRRAAVFQFVGLVMLPLLFMYFTQSDLGSVLICSVGMYAALWLSGAKARTLAVIAIAGVVAVFFAVFLVGYRSSRLIFMNPWNDGAGGLGDGYNIIHAYYAIAGGGLFGVGIGASHEKFDYLFAADSDFIFAVIAEETGLVGALLVIALFLVILFAGLRIASATDDGLSTMLAGAFAIMLVFQAFLNIGCTIGVLPTTGKPLPFISSGGSSVISSFMIVGIMLSVALEEGQESDSRRKRDEIRIVSTGGSGVAGGRSRAGRDGDRSLDGARDARRGGAKGSRSGRSVLTQDVMRKR